ncbi:MAG: xanthine dehydrogenase family protein subunit M [Gemmatimonadetes bacterium]|nr:xanthine dehydrogenase family protein subunit M [Gemmatimonadota bacterium]
MIPSPFDYHAPKTLRKALSLLHEHGGDAKILAGGHSLIPLMKLRFASPATLIDLGGISGLRKVVAGNETISIGALATHYAVESHRLLKSRCGLLPETASAIGDAQVRNRGTVGGSLVHADPAADWPATMLALDAQLDISGPGGERSVAVGDFFEDLLTVAIGEDEILTRIRIATPPDNSGGAYVKMHQSASGFAICGVAAQVTLDNGNCASVGIGVTGVSPVAYRASAAEAALQGGPLNAEMIAAAADKAADGVDDFQEDHHASGDYRAHLAGVFTRQALTAAAERAA